MTDIFQALAAPFPPEAISWRVGPTNAKAWERDKSKQKRGQALPYIDARNVMDRLDDVVGHWNWQAENIALPNGIIGCRIGIRNPETGRFLFKGDGAGPTGDLTKEYQREMAQKGGMSDALKRAAVLWGIGRYLYDITAPWIILDDHWKIPDSELPALRRLLTGTKEPSARSSREEFARIETALRNCQNLKALHTCWTTNSSAIANMAAGHRQALTEEKDRCKAILLAHEEVVA